MGKKANGYMHEIPYMLFGKCKSISLYPVSQLLMVFVEHLVGLKDSLTVPGLLAVQILTSPPVRSDY